MKKLSIVIAILIMLSAIWSWDLVEQQDKFGDPTGNSILSEMIVNGSFSNTATIKSKLEGFIGVFPDGDVAIRLFEYGSYSISGSGDFEKVEIKGDDGIVTTVRMINNTMLLSPKWHECNIIIKNLIKANNKLKFYYKDGTSTYKWELDCTGFSKLYEGMKND